MNTAACDKLEDYFSPDVWQAVVSVCPELRRLVPESNEIRSENALARLEPGPKGHYGLSYTAAGKTLRLASAVDPEAEDRALVRKFNLDPSRGIVCFGLGLGYYLEELDRLMKPGAPIWVLEARPELAACALQRPQVRNLLKRPGFKLFVGPFQGLPWANDSPPVQQLWRPATARNFIDEYPEPIQNKSRASSRPKLFKRLLLFQGGYFLDRELQNAAAELGLETATWTFQRRLIGDGREFNDLLSLVKRFRPEMVLTVNHLGFDAEGLLEDVFTRLNLPVATWFVDSPVFILKDYRPGPLVSAFTWDSDYCGWLAQKGFGAVHYLPLAADNTFFSSSAAASAGALKVSFVGDSLTAATGKFLRKIFPLPDLLPDGFMASVDLAAESFLCGSELWPGPALLDPIVHKWALSFSGDRLNDLAALMTWRASRIKRLKTLAAFTPEKSLVVAGDEHWADLLKLPQGAWRPPIDYYAGLADFYRRSLINLNITSAQMKSGLNQRVFDVPACGAFLLSDDQGQLPGLFEPGREVTVYQDPAEAVSLSDWYEAHDGQRQEIAAAARKRVLSQHLYRHRLREMLELMPK